MPRLYEHRFYKFNSLAELGRMGLARIIQHVGRRASVIGLAGLLPLLATGRTPNLASRQLNPTRPDAQTLVAAYDARTLSRPATLQITLPQRLEWVRNPREIGRRALRENLQLWLGQSPLFRSRGYRALESVQRSLDGGLSLSATDGSGRPTHRLSAGLDVSEGAVKLKYRGIASASVAYSPLSRRTELWVEKSFSDDERISFVCEWRERDTRHLLRYTYLF